jgi:hypothetical protein
MLAQHVNAPMMDIAIVHTSEQTHRRRIPRILAKKLDKTVWNPSAVSVTPGITKRMVRA